MDSLANWSGVSAKRSAEGATFQLDDPADSVTLSAGSAAQNGQSMQPKTGQLGGYGIGVDVDSTLTSADKALVIAATGTLRSAGSVNTLADTIAIERSCGMLSGPVTTSDLNKLKGDEQQTLVSNQQIAKQMIATGSVDEGEALAAQGPGISFAVLDKAIRFLNQGQDGALGG